MISKGCGHNHYGEPAWPNDILYVFPIVICGTRSIVLSLALESTLNQNIFLNPFYTPFDIQPEWYLSPSFNLLRILEEKFIGVLLEFYLPELFLIQPFFEHIDMHHNPFRRPLVSTIFLSAVLYSSWLSCGAEIKLSLLFAD